MKHSAILIAALALASFGAAARAQNSLFDVQLSPELKQNLERVLAEYPEFGPGVQIKTTDLDAAALAIFQNSPEFGSGQVISYVENLPGGDKTYLYLDNTTFATLPIVGIAGIDDGPTGLRLWVPDALGNCPGGKCLSVGDTADDIASMQKICDVKVGCNYGDPHAALEGCLMSTVGLFQPSNGFETDQRTAGSANLTAEVEASGLLLGDMGRFLLTAKHVKDGSPMDFGFAGSTHAITNIAAVNVWKYFPFRRVAAASFSQVPQISVEKDGITTLLDLAIASVEPGPTGRPGFGHRILRASDTIDLKEVPFFIHAGFGLRPQCGTKGVVTTAGMRRINPIEVIDCPSDLKEPKGAYEFCARTKKYSGTVTKACKIDSGSPVYAVLDGNRRAVVGMIYQLFDDTETCGRNSRFINLTNPDVQDALLNTLMDHLGIDRDDTQRRDELANEVFLSGDLIAGDDDEALVTAYANLPSP